MNCEYCPSAELRDLLAALDTGELTWEQDSRLQQLVAEDLTARRFYIEFVFLFGTLRRLHSQRSDATPVLGFLNNTWQQGVNLFSNQTFLSLLIATVVIGSLLGVLAILPAPTYERSRFNCAYNSSDDGSTTSGTGLRGVDKDGKFKFVARITGLHNCRWSDNYLPPLRYAHLGLGRELKLDAGLVKITYYNGATVVLEGPVEFTVEKANACRLDVGKLTAKVSKRAAGFTVETPTSTIVDLGTEFGVEVAPDCASNVYVFAGVVELQSDVDGTGQVVRERIEAGQAVRVDPQGKLTRNVKNVSSHGDRFVREVPKSFVPITAGFARGSGSRSVDQYPGRAGCGWAGPWVPHDVDALDESASIETDNPLNDAGPYLTYSVKRSSGNEKRIVTLARAFNAGSGVDLTKPYTISFDYRIDKLDTFDMSGDFISIYARHSMTTNRGGDFGWAICASAWPAGKHKDIPASTWLFLHGDGAGEYVPTGSGIEAAPGKIYTINVCVEPEHNRWTPSIAVDGARAETFGPFSMRTAGGSHQTDSWSVLHLEAGLKGGDDEEATVSIDSIRIVPSNDE